MRNLTFEKTIKQIKELKEINNKNIILDFSKVSLVRMSGMLLMISTIDYLKQKNDAYRFHIDAQAKYWDNGKPAIGYAGNIGFFTALGINKGKSIDGKKYLSDEHNMNKNNFCPIISISWDDLYKFNDYHDGIVDCSTKLANVLFPNAGEDQKEIIGYIMREILRNPFEHSTAKKVWVSAQKHPSDGYIEVVIADNAEGLKQTLSINKNVAPLLQSDIDAIRYSLQPGVSGGDTSKKDKWANSGYGLYVTSEIAKKLGSFTVVSGKKAVKYENGDEEYYSTDYQGTAIYIKFDIDKVNNIDNPSSLIDFFVNKGEKIANENPSSHKTASKASKTINM